MVVTWKLIAAVAAAVLAVLVLMGVGLEAVVMLSIAVILLAATHILP